ncbi:thiosulfate sulfurtransferase activity protein [[Candida] boidinii]|nr:thiosulfate sulfurtransferase activity protein [[Candida] boidinii]OWB62416.1 thiosulfate sulfurtransferase activity protein [[Candida] boidinii]OWB70999.1 thiosulfate sulfurtransferase activity protein [[Candida] boidinii]OWB78092.1 thiosulfate sulfurtransferase activity protein [[Candida] boidinii]GMF49956.1 unnamed protein product [[Candida] boidinii]
MMLQNNFKRSILNDFKFIKLSTTKNVSINSRRNLITITNRNNNLILNSIKNVSSISRTQSLINNKFTINNNLILKRNYSVIEEEPKAEIITFEQMQKLAENPSDDIVLVDVREPNEFAAGHIPHSINIPCKSSPGALGLSDEEFEITFGFKKPSTEKTLVFYCLGGVRSTIVEELAGTFGYSHRLNYVGSFEDWINNKGEVEYPKEAESAAEPAAEESAIPTPPATPAAEETKTEEPKKN